MRALIQWGNSKMIIPSNESQAGDFVFGQGSVKLRSRREKETTTFYREVCLSAENGRQAFV